MKALVRSIDRRLQEKLGVFEFSQDPDCIFRAHFDHIDRDIELPDCSVNKGDRVVHLHSWNERLPTPGDVDSNFEFGQRMQHMVAHSNQIIAHELDNNPKWAGVRAVGTTTAIFGNNPRDARMWARFGYTVLDFENPQGKWAEFWERVWTWALWHTYRTGTREIPPLAQIRRCDIWSSAAEIRRRFGARQ